MSTEGFHQPTKVDKSSNQPQNKLFNTFLFMTFRISTNNIRKYNKRKGKADNSTPEAEENVDKETPEEKSDNEAGTGGQE